MKRIKNILSVFVVLFALTTLYSCKNDEPEYTPADKLSTDQVYFPSTNSSKVSISSKANSFDVPISRVKTEDAITVPLTLTGGDDLYTIPESVTFEAGQATTVVPVSYNFAEIGFDKFTDLVISIAGQNLDTPYGLSKYAFNVGAPSPWISLGEATYVEDFVTTFFGVDNVSYKVEIQENELTPGLFRLVNPYGAAYPYNEPGDWDDSRNWYIEIDATDPTAVYMRIQQTGMNWGHGMFVIGSLAGYNISKGETPAQQREKGLAGTFEEGIITFPAEKMLIAMTGYNNGSFYYANTNGAFMVLMPGVELADYSIEATYLGRFTDTEDNNFAVGQFDLGADVETAKVAMVEGDDLNAAIGGMLDGTIETIELTKSEVVNFPVETSGTYSILAISFAKGEAQKAAYDTFEISIESGSTIDPPVAPLPRKAIGKLKKASLKTNLKLFK